MPALTRRFGLPATRAVLTGRTGRTGRERPRASAGAASRGTSKLSESRLEVAHQIVEGDAKSTMRSAIGSLAGGVRHSAG